MLRLISLARRVPFALRIGLALACLILPANAGAQSTPIPDTLQSPVPASATRPPDFERGQPDAPVVIVEYASVACPHCATFHAQAMPTIDRFIESGAVRLAFREMITGQPQLAVAGFMLARCAPREQYFSVLHALFEHQAKLLESLSDGSTIETLRDVTVAAGLPAADFQPCLANEARFAEVQQAHARAIADGIASTPTMVINDHLISTGPGPVTGQYVYLANGTPIEDADGPIPASFEGDSIERIILYFEMRASGEAGTPGMDESAG